MVKKYYTAVALGVMTIMWFFGLGPIMLSGTTELMAIWLLGTVFVVLPLIYFIVVKNLIKGIENEEK